MGVVTQTRECSRLIEFLEKVRVYKIMIPVIVTYKPIGLLEFVGVVVLLV